MTRKKKWDTKHYHQYLLERARTPFKWGANDCALFAADGILAFTGIDIAEDFRGKYHDEIGALETIKDVCGGATVTDAAAYCAQKHGLKELEHPLMAQRGDLVVAANADGSPIAGLVHLNGRHIVTVSSSGAVVLPIRSVLRAWRV